MYNLRLLNKCFYVKDKIDILMSFAKFGNNLNEDALSFLQHEEMENSEETIEYAIFISYAFNK